MCLEEKLRLSFGCFGIYYDLCRQKPKKQIKLMGNQSSEEKYHSDLLDWKLGHFLYPYSKIPKKPTYRDGEDALQFAKRLTEYNKTIAIWKTAPKPDDYGLISPILECHKIRIENILKFGSQHIRLFNFRLMSEVEEFEKFLIRNGFEYKFLYKENGSLEIDLEKNYSFITSDTSASFQLAIISSDSVHITGFYFYNDKGYKDEHQRLNTIADVHDLLIKDSRVVTKKIKSEKGCHNFIQDYIAPYEAARFENNSIYITTIEEYKRLPKYRWPKIKNTWIGYFIIILTYGLLIGFTILNYFRDKQEQPTSYKLYEDEIVFICTGQNSRTYHLFSDCYGLSSCSGEIKEITLEEAHEMERKECRFCIKRAKEKGE